LPQTYPRARTSRLQLRVQLFGSLGAGLALAAPGAARAQDQEPAEIVVTGHRPLTGIIPERSFESEDVEAYGVGTVGELIAEIAAEDGEDRDEPAFLVNGKRVPGLEGLADLPAEAILSLDVLPTGSGVRLGATPRQRVYNIRLRRELDLATARAGARIATSGGWSSRRGDLAYTHIRAERRITAAAKIRDDGFLLESERAIIQPAGSAIGAGRFRSLVPASDRIDFSLSASDQLADWLSASFNSKLSISSRQSLLGPFAPLGQVEEALDQRGRTLLANSDLSLNASIGTWSGSLFANHAYLRGRTSTERSLPGETDPVLAGNWSTTESLGAQIIAFGPVLELPAGPLVLNLTAGLSRDRIEGRREFQQLITRHSTRLTSSTMTAALEVPIASKGADVLAFLGDLSASGELSRQHVSGFGSFSNHSLSMLWRPVDALTLTGSIGRSSSAPPVASLDEPRLETPNVRYFDPLRGETVDVTRITGGTLALRSQRDVRKRIAANLTPLRSSALRLTAEYSESRTSNLISELPLASLSILDVFPERFIRDSGGRLIAVDARPVSFASRTEREVRTGLMLNLPLGGRSGPAAAVLADDDDDRPEAQSKRARPGVRPRLQVTASHSWLMASKLVVAPGKPAIDLLSRDAVGLGGLAQPRHRVDVTTGYAERGLGMRASAQWRSASFIEASGSTANTLRFEPLTTFSLRGWIQGERIAPASHWLKGTRISLSVLNLTNVRERVVDRFGLTPLAYQSAYRDPIGRSIEIELRKKF
jgi:hypothetical protein